jgi:hypothetical protein
MHPVVGTSEAVLFLGLPYLSTWGLGLHSLVIRDPQCRKGVPVVSGIFSTFSRATGLRVTLPLLR